MPSRRSTQLLTLVLLSSPWLWAPVTSGSATIVAVIIIIVVSCTIGVTGSAAVVTGIGVVGLALIGAAHALQLSGHTTWIKLELHRLPTTAQFCPLRSLQSYVGKSLGLTDAGSIVAGMLVEFEPPSTRLIAIELMSSSHLLQVLGQIKTARESLQTSLLAARSAQPPALTVSSHTVLLSLAQRPHVSAQMSRARREWHTSCEVISFWHSPWGSSSRQSPCRRCHSVLPDALVGAGEAGAWVTPNNPSTQVVCVQQSTVQWGPK